MAGPIRLEDANDLADVAENRRLMVPRVRWVDEYREEAENARLNVIF
jgi:hypothetical protein